MRYLNCGPHACVAPRAGTFFWTRHKRPEKRSAASSPLFGNRSHQGDQMNTQPDNKFKAAKAVSAYYVWRRKETVRSIGSVAFFVVLVWLGFSAIGETGSASAIPLWAVITVATTAAYIFEQTVKQK